MPRLHPTLLAPLVASLLGCASSRTPALRDSSGWPVPTYALMEGVTCVDPVDGRAWSPRELQFRDRNAHHEGLVCGRQRRAYAPFVPDAPPSAPPQPEPSRPPSVETVSQPALDTVR